MDQHTIEPDCVALVIGGDNPVSPDSAAALVRSALILNGQDAWLGMDVEVFCAGGCSMIIAHPIGIQRAQLAPYALPYLDEKFDF